VHRIWLQRRRDRPAIQLKNQRLIQLFQRSNVPVNPGKLKRRIIMKLLTLGFIVQSGLVLRRLAR
jgi:hypothetical protein